MDSLNKKTGAVVDDAFGKMSRRDFLGAAGVGTGAVLAAFATSSVRPKRAFADDEPIKEEWKARKAILFDAAKCIGCHYCEVGCKKIHGFTCDVSLDLRALVNTVYPLELLPIEMIRDSPKVVPVKADDRDAGRWLRVVQVAGTPAPAFANTGEEAPDGFLRHSCTHCGLCAKVCPARALVQREDGIVEVHPERCIGCKYCFQACPFDVPRFAEEGEDRAMRKCDMCATRVDEGKIPACVDNCPSGALKFGSMADLVAEGRASVAALKEAGMQDATLYGERELGGIGVMMVLPQAPTTYKMPALKKA